MRRQRGQVLLLMLSLWACLIGGFLLVFNVGQTSNAKLRLVNAADAAAYSGAILEARSLNLQAYLNRAIVANEATIAQAVSLRSWSAYMRQLLGNSAAALSWVPYLNSALRALSSAWRPIDRSLQSGLPPLESLASRWNVVVLANVERLAHAEAVPAVADLTQQVLKENLADSRTDPAHALFAARNARDWQALTRSYTRTGSQRARLADVVLRSRDGFTRQRNWNQGLLLAEVRKRGGTDLLGFDAWRGLDTLSVHVSSLFGHTELPLGWGGAESRLRATVRRGAHGGSWASNPRASRLASRTLNARNGYRGLPAFRDLTRPGSQRFPRLRLLVSAELPAQAIATSDHVMPGTRVAVVGSGSPAEHTVAARSLYALAAAEVSFRRPRARGDGRVEYASLFNPYWQARLSNVTVLERALAARTSGRADPYLELP